METTTNYDLKKPTDADGADINVISANMDIIDAELKKRASLDATGKVPKAQLPATGGYVRQDSAPTDTSLLWVDSASGNVMKFYNGSAWAPVPATWG